MSVSPGVGVLVTHGVEVTSNEAVGSSAVTQDLGFVLFFFSNLGQEQVYKDKQKVIF